MIIKYLNPLKYTLDEFLDQFHVSNTLKKQMIKEELIKEVDGNFELIEEGSKLIPFKSNIEVLYEDRDIIAVFKPSGMLVHSDGVTITDTLLNRVVYYFHGKVDVKVIHRIDVETCGVVIFSKNKLAHAYLNYQMENGLIKKEYECITHGKFKLLKGVIDKPIGKNRHENNKYLVLPKGKRAITEYEVINQKNDMNHVRVNLITGRTHQIRVHMLSVSCPIYSDKIYYHYEDMPLMLMSRKVILTSPDGFKKIEISTKKGLGLW